MVITSDFRLENMGSIPIAFTKYIKYKYNMKIKEIINMITGSWTPIGNPLLEFLKEKENTFFDYISRKYYFDSDSRAVFLRMCNRVRLSNKFLSQDLTLIQELGIPLGQINGFNLSGFRERTTPVSYDTFVTYLVNVCDNKFTVEQIKQTIESYDN